MPIDFEEKRSYIRMSIDCDISFKDIHSQEYIRGRCKNLSASGLMFTADQEVPPGTMLDINITPELSVVPPLDATIEVVRVNYDSLNNDYQIAGIIKEMRG